MGDSCRRGLGLGDARRNAVGLRDRRRRRWLHAARIGRGSRHRAPSFAWPRSPGAWRSPSYRVSCWSRKTGSARAPTRSSAVIARLPSTPRARRSPRFRCDPSRTSCGPIAGCGPDARARRSGTSSARLTATPKTGCTATGCRSPGAQQGSTRGDSHARRCDSIHSIPRPRSWSDALRPTTLGLGGGKRKRCSPGRRPSTYRRASRRRSQSASAASAWASVSAWASASAWKTWRSSTLSTGCCLMTC